MDFHKNMTEENKISMIQKAVKKSVSVASKRYKIDFYNLLDLDKILSDVYCSILPGSADYDARNDLVKRLNAIAFDIYGDSEENSPVLEAYGSFVMDMFFTQSDLDVSINFSNVASELTHEEKVQILKRFAMKLHSLEEGGGNVVSIFHARVPIARFCDQGTAVECDLSVENRDGILKSQIIRIISHIDDRFHKLCMLVKYWARAHEVNNAGQGTMNSLSITLLVALHLQTQSPPILPPFSMLFKDGIDPHNVEKRTQEFLNSGQRRNEDSLSRLFVTFFIKLQSIELLWRQGLCVSVLNGHWTFKKWNKGCMRVEDITDVSQNVARAVNRIGARKIYSSINRTVEDIFVFLNNKIDGTEFRNRLFGQQGVVQPPLVPLVPLLNDEFGGTKQQEAVVEPNNGRDEGHYNKRVRLEDDYIALGGTSHGKEKIYKKPRGKRIEYGGNWEGFDDSFSGEEEQLPVSLWHEYSEKYDLPPPPPPPYDRVYFETWSSKLPPTLFL